jgi:hypothetical protein
MDTYAEVDGSTGPLPVTKSANAVTAETRASGKIADLDEEGRKSFRERAGDACQRTTQAESALVAAERLIESNRAESEELWRRASAHGDLLLKVHQKTGLLSDGRTWQPLPPSSGASAGRSSPRLWRRMHPASPQVGNSGWRRSSGLRQR